MNIKMTENAIKRLIAEDEKKIREVQESEQKENENWNLQFKLVGFLNRLDIIPDFVIPIFTCVQNESDEPNHTYYFAVGSDEEDRLTYFSKLNNYGEELVKRISFVSFDIKDKFLKDTLFTIDSTPLHAFQKSDTEVEFGTYSHMRDFFTTYETDDSILKKEIQDFLDLESSYIWERLELALKKYFPNDDAAETQKKLATLKNDEFLGETLELYLPEFKGEVLRVGVRIKGIKMKEYFDTDIGIKLKELLLD